MSPDAYLPRKNRYDSFPWQVQAYRAGRWCVISCHISEARADKGLAQIRKCTPSSPNLYRKVFCESDDFIWDNPANRCTLADGI